MERRPDDLTVARLILSRQRRQGIDFDTAWQRMLDAIPEHNGKDLGYVSLDRNCTVRALHDTADEWRLAYLGLPKLDPKQLRAAEELSLKYAASLNNGSHQSERSLLSQSANNGGNENGESTQDDAGRDGTTDRRLVGVGATDVAALR